MRGSSSTNAHRRGTWRQAGPDEGLQGTGIGTAAGLGADDRHRRLSPSLVGHAHHGRLGHVGMLEQHAFDLHREDVLTAGDDHLLGAPGHAQEAPVVHGHEVPRPEPPPRRHGGGRLLGQVEVAGHDVGTVHLELPHLAARHHVGRARAHHPGAHTGQRLAERRRLVLGLVVEPGLGDEAARLGLPEQPSHCTPRAASMRRTSSAGTTAPPPLTARSDARSRPAKSACPIRASNMVGTPHVSVARSDSTRSRTSPGSKDGTSTAVADSWHSWNDTT